MRIILVLAICLIACTKQNPNLCCIDEADCANVGLDDVKGCGDGLLCRGNQCIAEVCESSAECDADAPYCVAPPDGRCQQDCTSDEECPGFGEDPTQRFCEAGSCVECRDDNDCDGVGPRCNSGACVACTRNEDCASGVCVEDGSCADPTDVAYVAPDGAATGDCSEASPCSKIEFALSVPARRFIVIESGTYVRDQTLTLNGDRRLIGRGPTLPIISRTTQGPIANATSGVVSLEGLEISGATGTTSPNFGHGLACAGGAEVTIVDSVFRQNARNGVDGQICTVRAFRSKFIENNGGLSLVNAQATIDACEFSGNSFKGAGFDAGLYVITNSFFTRNAARGLDLFASTSGSHIEFNTIVDNGNGFECQATPDLVAANNLVARNAQETTGNGSCTFAGSIIADTDIAALKFVSPDVEPFDYHIQEGSIAIDAAGTTVVDHDFDGDPRPSSAADVGADEI